MSSCKRLARTGFTLIELMVVMVILVLLAALVLPRVMNRAEEARRKTSIIQMSGLRGAHQLRHHATPIKAHAPVRSALRGKDFPSAVQVVRHLRDANADHHHALELAGLEHHAQRCC